MDLWRISNYSDSQGDQRQTDNTTPGAAGNVCVVKRPRPCKNARNGRPIPPRREHSCIKTVTQANEVIVFYWQAASARTFTRLPVLSLASSLRIRGS